MARNHARVVWYVDADSGEVFRSWLDDPARVNLSSGWQFGGALAFWSRTEAEKFSRFQRRTRMRKLKEAEKRYG